MKHWFTTHWPRRTDEPDDQPHHGVWIPDGMLSKAAGMVAGDRVFIYESSTGRAALRRYADGTTTVVPCRAGRCGTVMLAEITDKPFELDGSQPEDYEDGTRKWWRYCAPTQPLNTAGFLPREETVRLLGYNAGYYLRGFGGGSGLKEIDRATFDRLLAAFRQSCRPSEERVLAEVAAAVRAAGRAGSGRGEGAQHLALKQRIAADPAAVLGEPGLTHWQTEWPLPTGDRIDIVLIDAVGRFVVVEVEVDCEVGEIAGPLQCMKYRAMMGYLAGQRETEVRAMLAAHSIHGAVSEKCARFKIETHVVAR